MSPSLDAFRIVTLRDQPDLEDSFWPQKPRIWPPFMFHDIFSKRLWDYLGRAFAAFQFYLLDEQGQPVACGHSIPLTWDATLAGLPIGWYDCLVRGAADYEAGRPPDTLAALEIAIRPEYQGQGVSYRMIHAMRDLARQHGLQAVIAAVRPSLKHRYPITPMDRYARWRRADGSPFDPWLRVHWRVGAEILRVAHPSMIIEGSADDWERWTGLRFPESGDYVVEGALVPIHIDRESNFGRYIEPNIWVHHPLRSQRLTPTEPA